jgi:hypothetical protein
MAFKWGFNGVALTLSWLAPYQTTGLFIQARVLDSTGAVVATVDLTANATIAYNYEGSWTPAADGEYRAIYDVYESAAARTAGTPKSESISGADDAIRVKDVTSTVNTTPQIFGNSVDLNEEQIKKISKDIIKSVWKEKLSNGATAEDTLITRSDFDPEHQLVKTDIKIPEVSFTDLEDKIDVILKRSNKADVKKELAKLLKDNESFLSDKFKDIITEIQNKYNQNDVVIGYFEELRQTIIENAYKGSDDKKILDKIEESNAKNSQKIEEVAQNISSLLDNTKENIDSIKFVELSQALDSLNTIIEQNATNNKMMEALNSEDGKRIKIVLEAINGLSKKISQDVEKINLGKVFDGFAMINKKINENETIL